MNEPIRLLTDQDHENGFKDVEVVYRSGRRETVRVTAIPHRPAQRFIADFFATLNPFCISGPSLPEDKREEKFLDKLTPQSASELENYAFALTLGEETMGKWISQTEAILTSRMSTPGAEPKQPSSELDTPSNT
jgi:hypothetical protein